MNKTVSRWLVVLWLVLSQLGGILLALVPIVVMGAIALMTLAGGGMPALFAMTCLSIILPTIFALAAWIAFAWRKDKVAAILSGICLLIGAALYIAMEIFTKSLNN